MILLTQYIIRNEAFYEYEGNSITQGNAWRLLESTNEDWAIAMLMQDPDYDLSVEDVARYYIEDIQNVNPKFIDTPYLDWQVSHPNTKAARGERIAKALMFSKGYSVGKRESSTHDFIADGKKVEVKTAFECRDVDYFMIYGYDPSEDPHYWLLQLVTPKGIFHYQVDRQVMSHFYHQKSKKNTMISLTLKDLEEAGAVLIGTIQL